MSQNTEAKSKHQYIQQHLQSSQEMIRSLKAQQDEKRSLAEKFADFVTEALGSMGFLFINVVWFFAWIILNIGIIPNLAPFDPFPFGLLTMIVSLEAIALAIIVLISQNRSSKIAELREEVDLQVDMLTERELTKMMQIVCLIAEKQGIDLTTDKELQTMLEPTSMSKIETTLEKQVIGDSPQQHHKDKK